MLKNYLIVFFLSMTPLLEIRFSVFLGMKMGLPFWPMMLLCVVGNMIPVPFIYLFARKFLCWGVEKKYIGKICAFLLEKGERAGQKLVKTAGRGGLFVAMLVFVGIPVPGTGAWTGTLGASFLNMGFKSTVVSVCLGVIMACGIIALTTAGVFSALGW